MTTENNHLQEVDKACDSVREAFNERITFPLEFRKDQLKKLAYTVVDNKHKIHAALQADLGKHELEADVTEMNPVIWAIEDAIENAHKWAKPAAYPALQPVFKLYQTAVQHVPSGPALLISPWNYPWKLAIEPLVAAISAGAPAVIKPSEISPATSEVIKELVEKALDPRCYAVILGGVEETTRLLERPWGRVLFTGGERVGKIVAIAAAKTLSPCTLELGGKCPAIIDDGYDLMIAARRTMCYKAMNCSQTCTTCDYTLISAQNQDAYIECCLKVLGEFFPDGEMVSDSYGNVPSSSIDRLEKLMRETKGRVIRRGEIDRERRKVGISIVADVMPGDVLLQEEIFGPILVISTVESIKAAVAYINSKPSPLGVYVFTEKKATVDYVTLYTQSGAVLQNDCALQALIDNVPFGGVGASGFGAYHSKWGFDLFTQERAIIKVPTWLEALLSSRYPPFTASKHRLLQMTMLPLPLSFARPGTKGLAYVRWWFIRRAWRWIGFVALLVATGVGLGEGLKRLK